MAITKEDIFRAANEIDELGQSPTLSAVRKRLGGGSFTTISEAMSEWKKIKASKETDATDPVPQAIESLTINLTKELWNLATSLANERLNADRKILEELREDLQSDKQNALNLSDQISIELDETKTKLASVEVINLESQTTIKSLQYVLSSTKEILAVAESRATELSGRVDDLNSELLRVHAQNSELIKALASQGPTKMPPGVFEANGNI